MIRHPAAQGVCERCGAWLPVRPDFAEFESYVVEKPDPKCPHRSPTDSEVWSPFAVDNFYCDECVIEEDVEKWVYRYSCLECGWPKERRDPRDPLSLFPADLSEVYPPGQAAHPAAWRLPRTLIVHVNFAAARHCHRGYSADLARLTSLLDYGGRRVARWGSVYEDRFGDPHKVRLSLARLRHARRDGNDARAAWLLCERAVLAVNQLYVEAPILARRVCPNGEPGPLEVAPVLGGGALSIDGRYTAWMKLHHGFPYLFDPEERWHDRMRRRFAGLPDPPLPEAEVPKHLEPLWQFADVADDLAQLASRCRRSGDQRAQADFSRRTRLFRELCARGELERKLAYRPQIREPGYVPEYQVRCEADFV